MFFLALNMEDEMTIKHIGKRCGLCDKTFTLFSSPFACNSCGQLAHPRCGKREFVPDQATSDTLRKASICISCSCGPVSVMRP